MNILMMTNTYKPILGGLEKSVENFSNEFRKRGNRVIIVAPDYEGAAEEEDVIRIPAITNFKGTDFSIQLPIPGILSERLGDFRPDIVHSHHPYFVGDAALRMAYRHNVPLVFTHHTLYEQNTHYLGEGEGWKRFVIELATCYANLADCVFAPSESVEELIRSRGVTVPVEVVPTGIKTERFAKGDGAAFRERQGIPKDAWVVGHIGRLAKEKNLEFVAQAITLFLKSSPDAHLLIAGTGPLEEGLLDIFTKEKVAGRVHMAGKLTGSALIDAYHAMDVFAFASQSETQGLVLAEAMAAGVPIVAVDAPGVREVVQDGVNGRLLPAESLGDFFLALQQTSKLPKAAFAKMREACRETAEEFAMQKSVLHALAVYVKLRVDGFKRGNSEEEGSAWQKSLRVLKAQWEITKGLAKAAGTMIAGESPEPSDAKPPAPDSTTTPLV